MAEKNVPQIAHGFNSAQSPSSTSLLAIARAMTASLVDLTAAERDMGDNPGCFDPALCAYRAAVDDARARVLAQCDALVARPHATLQASCLQRVAALVRTVVGSGDAGEVSRIRVALGVARWFWQVPEALPGRRFYNAALDRALDALSAFIDAPNGPQEDPPTAGPHLAMGAGDWPAANQPVPVAHSAVSFAFAGLLRDLDACVAAVGRIQRDVVTDTASPEFAQDFSAAEAAEEDLLPRLTHVLDQPVERDLDLPLSLLALNLKALLSMEDDGDRVHLHGLMTQNAGLLLVPGGQPAARRVRALQEHFFWSVARLMSMEDYGGQSWGPEDDGPDAPGYLA
jgi:hypothetical protein